MSDEFPYYPELTEQAQKEADRILKRFVDGMAKEAEAAVHDFYVSCLPHIESDSWTNFQNEIMDAYQDYGSSRLSRKHDMKKIRKKILEDNREQIIKDLDQDMVEEIASLKKTLEYRSCY